MEMDDLISELMPIFLGELNEHVKLVIQELITFESEKDNSARIILLESMFRTVHSLKGASRAVALNTAASICHELENFFSAVQSGAVLSSSDFELLYKTCDALGVMGELLQTGDANAERRLAPLLFTLRETASRLLNSVALAPAIPTAPHLPTEAAQFAEESIRQTREKAYVEKKSAPWAANLENSVRLPVAKLDHLLAEGSDLVTIANRNSVSLHSINQIHDKVLRWQRERPGDKNDPESLRLHALSKELEQLKYVLQNEDRHLTSAVNQVTSGINGLRMIPIGQACQGIDRVVRDVAVANNKQIELVFAGMNIEVDRNVLEQLRDPIMHLVRNCCDHGVETVEERSRIGKRPESTIKVQASVVGSQAVITVSDDGRGLNAETIRNRARKLGLPIPDDEAGVKNLIFKKGFSTSPIITETSGRGIGLDIVKEKIEGLHGAVEVDSILLAGATFTMTVPLTLTNMRVLFARAGGQLFATSTASIQKVIRIGPEDCEIIEGRTVITVDGQLLPVVSLAHVLDMPSAIRDVYKTPAMVITSGLSKVAIVTEELLTEQEVLVKNLGVRIRRVKHIGGSTILANGQIALILNAAEVVRTALAQHNEATGAVGMNRDTLKANAPRRRLLLADDSITTRSLEKSILESAGFEVTTCVDGAQAWQMINEKQFDLVVSDVEMPRMDGFALTRRIKSSNKHMHLPVILVTALSSERHKALGISSGADAYLVKSEFERSDLLEVINQLI